MSIEIGTTYMIADGIKGFYNSSTSMTITRFNGGTVQFLLADGKGHGSMPYQHFQYLLKRSELSLGTGESKKEFLHHDDTELNIS